MKPRGNRHFNGKGLKVDAEFWPLHDSTAELFVIISIFDSIHLRIWKTHVIDYVEMFFFSHSKFDLYMTIFGKLHHLHQKQVFRGHCLRLYH